MSTGLKDDDLETQYNLFQEHIIDKPKPYYRYDQGLEPDVWFDTAKVRRIAKLYTMYISGCINQPYT